MKCPMKGRPDDSPSSIVYPPFSIIITPSLQYSNTPFLHGQHDFAEVIPSFEIALRRAGFRQRKTFADHHLKFLLRYEFENLVELFEIFRLGFQIIRYRKARRLTTFVNAGGVSGIAPKAPPMENSRPFGASTCKLF